MSQNPLIYVESLTIKIFIQRILPIIFRSQKKSIITLQIYYIECTKLLKLILEKFSPKLNIKFSRLDFKLIDIRDNTGELVRFRLVKQDMFWLREKLLTLETIKNKIDETRKNSNFKLYFGKELTSGGIQNVQPGKGAARVLFLLNVIHWHMKSINSHNCIAILGVNEWKTIYTEYANKLGITVQHVNRIAETWKQKFNNWKLDLVKYTILYYILKYFKKKSYSSNKSAKNNDPKTSLAFIGRGNYSTENNGQNTDLFFQLHSELPANYLVLPNDSPYSKKDVEKLIKHGINISPATNRFPKKYVRTDMLKAGPEISIMDAKRFNIVTKRYNQLRSHWAHFFIKNNIKIFLAWNKYGADHIAIHDALNTQGGVSAIWQLAYEEFPLSEVTTVSDLHFSFSSFNLNSHIQQGSKISYFISTGYLQDFRFKYLKPLAQEYRLKLNRNGAKKIIACFDENSHDPRWHTGHDLQRENYRMLLEKTLEHPWLGVLFKPKTPATLKKRLGPELIELLEKAQKTGRVHVFMEQSATGETGISPILAALASDVAIQGHLSAGTTGMECALAGIPSILIDREKVKKSRLHELGEGKVVFPNWDENLWEALLDHFNRSEKESGLGDWSPLFDELDPFRDGKAAERMGNYLYWLLQGFEQGLSKTANLEKVAEKYAKRWGADKITSVN